MNSSLEIDASRVAAEICLQMNYQLGTVLGRRGFVVGMSGGVDSSVCAALAVRAVGADRVLGLLMPERESSPESTERATAWAEELGIEYRVEELTPLLEAAGCYERRDEAIRELVPEYGSGWKCKLTLSGSDEGAGVLSLLQLTLLDSDGTVRVMRPPPDVFRQIVAATNFKQRCRKMMEYHHADRLHYAVLGTPNLLEHDLGFFVKGGDGLADLKPIAHLYKSQVYQLAEWLELPASIRSSVPTTDTFPLEQTQQEFFFSFPLETLDQLLYRLRANVGEGELAAELDLPPERIRSAVRQIRMKQSAARYLHLPPILIDHFV